MVEREIQGELPEKKAEVRLQKSLPILEEIYREASGFDPPPRSVLGKAIKYTRCESFIREFTLQVPQIVTVVGLVSC